MAAAIALCIMNARRSEPAGGLGIIQFRKRVAAILGLVIHLLSSSFRASGARRDGRKTSAADTGCARWPPFPLATGKRVEVPAV